MSTDKSFFHSVTDVDAKPLWVLRVFAIASLLPLLLAMFFFKAGNAHNFCIGLSVGVLVGMVAQTFAISSVEMKHDPQPSEVDNVSFIR